MQDTKLVEVESGLLRILFYVSHRLRDRVFRSGTGSKILNFWNLLDRFGLYWSCPSSSCHFNAAGISDQNVIKISLPSYYAGSGWCSALVFYFTACFISALKTDVL